MLKADFKAGKVDGEITGVTSGTGGASNNFPDKITLMESDIGSTGGFSGKAEFDGKSVARKTGAWEGKFYGPTTMMDNGKQKHVAPSHVAGTFSASGRMGTGDAAKDMHVRGAFGSDNDPDN